MLADAEGARSELDLRLPPSGVLAGRLPLLAGGVLDPDLHGFAAQFGDTYQVLAATDGLGGSAFSNTTVVAEGLIWDILLGAEGRVALGSQISLGATLGATMKVMDYSYRSKTIWLRNENKVKPVIKP